MTSLKGRLYPNSVRFLCVLSLLMLITGCVTGYQVQEEGVIYITWDEGSGRQEFVVSGADPHSFQVIEDKLYAKDKRAVYYRKYSVVGADPRSFRLLTERYSLDAYHVYLNGKLIPGADPATFQLITSDWARDKNDIYLASWPIESCDPATFRIVNHNWAVDSQCAYASFNKLPGADPGTFSALNRGYAKDKDHVYAAFTREFVKEELSELPAAVQNNMAITSQSILYLAHRIDLADTDAFVVDDKLFENARDRYRCFRRGVVVECLD